jgi:hypothetical protein
MQRFSRKYDDPEFVGYASLKSRKLYYDSAKVDASILLVVSQWLTGCLCRWWPDLKSGAVGCNLQKSDFTV